MDPYNFELYRFKDGPFFETRCISLYCALNVLGSPDLSGSGDVIGHVTIR